MRTIVKSQLPVLALEIDEEGTVAQKSMQMTRQGQLENTLLDALWSFTRLPRGRFWLARNVRSYAPPPPAVNKGPFAGSSRNPVRHGGLPLSPQQILNGAHGFLIRIPGPSGATTSARHTDVVQPARVSLKVTLSTLTSEFLFINLATFADLLGWQA
jgi:hypothetical protein